MAGQLLSLGVLAALALVACGQQNNMQGRRIWMLQVGHDWGAHEYFDDAGYLKGFAFGLIDLVCTAGQMDCRTVWDKYPNCWNNENPGEHPSGGTGLISGWYDACTGWVPTVERIHTFAFTRPHIKQQFTYFWVKKGNQGSFTPGNLQGKKIAFLDGWASTEQCLARQTQIANRILPPNQVKHYPNPSDGYQGVIDGLSDAIYASEDTFSQPQKDTLYQFTQNRMSCYLDGHGMMARKDSDFVATWNTAFNKLRDNNKFNKFCEASNKEHMDVGRVDCITF